MLWQSRILLRLLPNGNVLDALFPGKAQAQHPLLRRCLRCGDVVWASLIHGET